MPERWLHLAGLLLAGLWGVLVVLLIVQLPRAHSVWTQNRRHADDLLEALSNTNAALYAQGPVSPTHVQDLAAEAAGKGAVWSPSLFALLDDAKLRNMEI